jgi:hypothetical protein
VRESGRNFRGVETGKMEKEGGDEFRRRIEEWKEIMMNG